MHIGTTCPDYTLPYTQLHNLLSLHTSHHPNDDIQISLPSIGRFMLARVFLSHKNQSPAYRKRFKAVCLAGLFNQPKLMATE